MPRQCSDNEIAFTRELLLLMRKHSIASCNGVFRTGWGRAFKIVSNWLNDHNGNAQVSAEEIETFSSAVYVGTDEEEAKRNHT